LWLGGDSITAGASSPYSTVYPAALTALINSRIAPAALTWATALSPTGTVDPRVSSTGWSNPNSGYWLSSSDGATLSYAPAGLTVGPHTVDTVDIYWIPLWNGGSFSVSANGGAPLGAVNTRVAGYAHKTTVSLGSSMTAPTITITATQGPVLIVALNAYDSAKPMIQVGNFGFSGSAASGWQWPLGRNGNGFAIMYAAYPPDLMVLGLGVNDAGQAESPDAYSSYMQTLISRGHDVLLTSMVPSMGTPWTTYEPQYVSAIKALASANNIGVVDTWTRWGGSYAAGASVGWYQDAFHPSALGNADIATAVYQALRVIG
jgi:lysophospholipase L1-like esterase